jgi:UDP-4-amino-4,6-dideoxy-N-acetyl-beta-L-altrosamine transaminase
MTMARFLPYSRQRVGSDDVRAVTTVLRSDWITQGPAVEAFEEAFARACGSKHAVAMANGTAALHAACAAAGLGPGDEAVVPPITFVATANAVLYVGARPVFADVDPGTALLDPGAFEAAITPRTRAVLPVDFAGHPCRMDEISRIARKRKLVVIEDAAHSLGASWKGRRVGSMADLTIFSFHPVKHITTGEGGMVVTDDADLARRLRIFRSHGITRDPKALTRDEGPWYYEQQSLGFNYRLTDFQCALGSSQLAKAAPFIRARRAVAALYGKALPAVDGVRLPVERSGARHVYHLYPVQVPAPLRRAAFETLRARQIGVQVHYYPVHLQPYYRHHLKTRPGLCPAAEAFYAGEISLPCFPGMRPGDVHRVARELEAALRGSA